ncbi:Uncharacterised protein [Cedecea neteri]|uniref:Uncharacterized protein n=1 Tax=Cedecea neteri TaxID=158822 RepID=A0A2X3IXF2_9ENTR|nr:Uncharacterised protein [Cedecea neteri]
MRGVYARYLQINRFTRPLCETASTNYPVYGSGVSPLSFSLRQLIRIQHVVG